MNTKLNWKLKWLDDKSGCWYSAKVPILNWEYIVEVDKRHEYNYKTKEMTEISEYVSGILYSKYDDDLTHLTKKEFYKKLDAAKAACEKHLKENAEKFNKWLKPSK